YVVSIDAKVQETRRIPAGACVPNQGVASARRYVGKDDVLAVTWRWPRSAIDSGPCFAVVERHLIVQPVPSVPGAVVRAKPQSDYVAGSSHWKSDRPRSARPDKKILPKSADLWMEVGIDELPWGLCQVG